MGELLRGRERLQYSEAVQMSASKWHWRAKALENAGRRLERLGNETTSPDTLRLNQIEVVRQAARFVSDLLGESAKFKLLPGEAETELIAEALRAWSSVFMPAEEEERYLWIETVLEISRFQFGDEPEFLVPRRRAPGQHNQPGRLAMARLKALSWARYFKGQGLQPKFYQPAIELAFSAEWDAIRHWKGSIARTLGPDYVERKLSYAVNRWALVDTDQSVLRAMFVDGEDYRNFVGLQARDEQIFHTEWENLARSLSIAPTLLES